MIQPTAFWDTSALVPLCVVDSTSGSALTLAMQYAPVVWWATSVEMTSAIARRHRSGELNDADKEAALGRLGVLRKGWREILPGDALRERAEALLHSYSLRAADSLQLAAALIWCRQRPAGRPFVSFDERLCAAATQAGFKLLRPVLDVP